MIGVFAQYKIRRIYENSNFVEREVEYGNRTVFNDDATLAIEVNEAMKVTDAYVKDRIMPGAWKIKNDD